MSNILYSNQHIVSAQDGMVQMENFMVSEGFRVNEDHRVLSPGGAYQLAASLLASSLDGFNQNRREGDKLPAADFITGFAFSVAKALGVELPLEVTITEDDLPQNKA